MYMNCIYILQQWNVLQSKPASANAHAPQHHMCGGVGTCGGTAWLARLGLVVTAATRTFEFSRSRVPVVGGVHVLVDTAM